MAGLESTFKNMFLVLTGVTVVATGVLASVNQLTKKTIETTDKQQQIDAIKAVLPAFDNDPVSEIYYVTDSKGDSLKVFPAKKGDAPVGLAVETFSDKGFAGNIKVMVGFDVNGTIVNYKVLQHSETPGLGSKMDDWFRTNRNSQSIIGKVPGDEGLQISKKANTEGYVDGITAATISSRAFADAVNKAYKSAYSMNDASTGATSQDEPTQKQE